MAALDPSIAVAVIGAGTMGAGIAQVAAMAGHPVYLYDTRAGAAAEAIAGMTKTLQALAAKQKIDAAQASRAVAALHAADSLGDLADCGLVIEAIIEQLDAKTGLFGALESIVAPDCLLATNTSSIPVTAIGAALKHPGRLGGMHFFNPAPRLPLVEIISGLDTTDETARTLFDTAAAWGKTPVLARSTPGFIVNRVARPFYGEGLRLLQEQALDAATLDHILRACGGFRMGPCELTDLIGQDINAAVSHSVWTSFHYAARFEPSLLQQELVDGGRLGRKSGRGFFDYTEGAAAPAPTLAAAQPCPGSITLFGDSPLARALGQRLQAAGVVFQVSADRGDGRIAQADDALLYLTDGRSATQRAHDLQQPATVLLDLALDPVTASCMPLAAARQCPPTAVNAATGLLQAAGLAVAPIRDVPGMVVMRTVAMLVNEAADTVNQGVCSAADVDQAMLLGVNYPLGPLAWCARIGAAEVGTVLTHLQTAYGARYQPCTALKSSIYSGTPLHVA
ncbi:3-hydroxyacyl-CoA dehydrogenase [Castellaniella sp.]|uniref:3-hydroxyacyl-CoA dehydrogenase n=1 Tax=Castellaniella sp. TaxID=1955812 RepID=UPI002AFFF3F3|nr:3-hydroxyacyl-CoA dehydrogenase [Castellaniella sp.]